MKGLLDTHTFLWWDSEPSRLSDTVFTFLREPSNTVLLSVVSVWEMAIKTQLGRLELKLPLREIVTQQQANGLQILPVTLDHVLGLEVLPSVHKDPFDRLLVAQAIAEGAVLLSSDETLGSYPVHVIW